MPAAATDITAAIEAVRSFFAAYSAHDVNTMVAACSDDARLRYAPMGNQGEGKAREVGKKIWSGIIEAFPDLTVSVQSIFGDGRNVAAEVLIGGRQQRDFLGIRSQGNRYELPHAFPMSVNESRHSTAITAYWDNASFYMELGKTTLP
jgi:ketosteroid isomerase-like protein